MKLEVWKRWSVGFAVCGMFVAFRAIFCHCFSKAPLVSWNVVQAIGNGLILSSNSSPAAC